MRSSRFSILRRVPGPVWVLGFVSMLMDISSEIVHSLLPMFLVSNLGTNIAAVGLIEGIAEATSQIVKIFSGSLSDYLGNRKWLAVAGYALGAASKPFFAIAASAHLVLLARFVDRIGKGVRGAPRDALVADITPPDCRGAAFGLRQSLDTVGAFTGPLIAAGLMLCADLVLAHGTTWVPVLAGMALWGLHMGMSQGLLAVMVAHAAPASLKGTAFGFFNLVSGSATLLASVIAGVLWERLGPATTFHASAVFGVIAAVLILGHRHAHDGP